MPSKGGLDFGRFGDVDPVLIVEQELRAASWST
jgi:hypothetical protein